MTSPLSPEAVAQMAETMRNFGDFLGTFQDCIDAADMLTTLAAENATLRSERDAWTKIDVARDVDFATLRASEAAALERVNVLELAMIDAVELAHGVSFSESKIMADWGYRVETYLRTAIAPTSDKEPTT